MAAEAGWYPDPMGDATKLRYWNGAAWTDDYAPAQGQATTAAQPTQSPFAGAAAQATPMAQPMAAAQAVSGAAAIYPMTDTDRTLRLVAFILNIITAVACCWAIIPLAWMIPMTVRSYGIYKGTKPNTVAMGVCTLIFVNIVSGVLLLCSNKDA